MLWAHGAGHLIPSKGHCFSLVESSGNCDSFLLKLVLLFCALELREGWGTDQNLYLG